MQRIFNLLESNNVKNVAIFSHIRGDGDCLGAQTGLAEILNFAGYQVNLYNQDCLSKNYRFFQFFNEIKEFKETDAVPDICIAVDCANYDRMGCLPNKLAQCKWINIDHHISNSMFGILNIVDGSASSTCEILAKMAFEANVSFSKDGATSLFSGISTDTGSFLYPNASSETFRIAARLLEMGADKNLVQLNVFENTSRTQLNIYKYLYSNIQYILEGQVAYCAFSEEIMHKLEVTSEDFEGVVSLIKQIQGVELAILLTEINEGVCKISMRSKTSFNTNKCCKQFGGGGHVRASGATIKANPDIALNAVLKEVEDQWEENANVK